MTREIFVLSLAAAAVVVVAVLPVRIGAVTVSDGAADQIRTWAGVLCLHALSAAVPF